MLRTFHKFFSVKNKAIIALGSNMGNRFQNISNATALLRGASKVVKTSQLYENPTLDQTSKIVQSEGQFLNGAVQVETTLSVEDLLQFCKSIERVSQIK